MTILRTVTYLLHFTLDTYPGEAINDNRTKYEGKQDIEPEDDKTNEQTSLASTRKGPNVEVIKTVDEEAQLKSGLHYLETQHGR